MTKTITFSGTATDVSTTERDQVYDAADLWHDPANGQVVNHVTYSYALGGEDVPDLSLAFKMEDVDVDNVQTVRDNLADAIDNLPLDFGTLTEIKNAISID